MKMNSSYVFGDVFTTVEPELYRHGPEGTSYAGLEAGRSCLPSLAPKLAHAAVKSLKYVMRFILFVIKFTTKS
jgi:hypothetical protein